MQITREETYLSHLDIILEFIAKVRLIISFICHINTDNHFITMIQTSETLYLKATPSHIL